jgi:hypothetical protein
MPLAEQKPANKSSTPVYFQWRVDRHEMYPLLLPNFKEHWNCRLNLVNMSNNKFNENLLCASRFLACAQTRQLVHLANHN